MDFILLFFTALVLGIRHGLDFDHIAAMVDMAGTLAADGSNDKLKGEKLFSLTRIWHNVKLPGLYVLGHGLMVVVLGLAALAFGSVIPTWLDEIMEKTVGVTLLVLSVYLFYSLFLFATKGQEFKLRSRWMLVFAAFGNAWSWLKAKVTGRAHSHTHTPANWDAKGAFLVGLIHGFGAETGTQVLLFASVVGVGNYVVGLWMLTAFTLGMTISTLGIALCVAAGLTTSSYFKSAMVVLVVLAAIFSLTVGLYFTFGMGDSLPSF